ncbi:MAG: hypothetical protein IJQ14_02515 [Bacteroidales bacterium]|nr:hypothetical protein [Bacteroidales bacterium]
MKTTLKLLIAVLMTGWYNYGNAQYYDWKGAPKYNEKVVGFVTDKVHAGYIQYFVNGVYLDGDPKKNFLDQRTTKSDEELYVELSKKARAQYGYQYPNLELRNFKSSISEEEVNLGRSEVRRCNARYYKISASVVVPNNPEPVKNNNSSTDNSRDDEGDDLTKALDKALQDIREGSRIAIDQVRVPSDVNKEEYKDEVVEILLDKGYKVVAKEYLEKLYEEQQAQQSGIYNDRTTVKDNNFSAVGYYLNVRLTETSLRVQIINVSTGEYDANVTIKF